MVPIDRFFSQAADVFDSRSALQSLLLMPEERKLYRVIFFNQGKIYELYAKKVDQADLFGFIRISDLVFGEKSQVLVDPTEDSLKQEFENTEGILVPLHSMIRIDEMNKSGQFKPRVLNMPDGAKQAANTPSNLYSPPDPFKP